MLHHEYAGSFFFGSGTDQDAIDSSLMIVELGRRWTRAARSRLLPKTDPKSVKIREEYVELHSAIAGPRPERAPSQAKADADATLKIETALANASLTRVQRRDPHNTYHMQTIEELAKLAPSIDWAYLLQDAGRARRQQSSTSRNPSS